MKELLEIRRKMNSSDWDHPESLINEVNILGLGTRYNFKMSRWEIS